MASIDDPGVKVLLDKPNHAVCSSLNDDGSIHSTVDWVSVQDGCLAVNSAVGRRWPTNLERDPHIDRLAKNHLDADSYPFRQPGEQRITYLVDADRVRHQKQG